MQKIGIHECVIHGQIRQILNLSLYSRGDKSVYFLAGSAANMPES